MTRWIFLVVLILGISIYASTINSAHGIGLEARTKEGKLIASIGDQSSKRNPFELGLWAIPVFISNAIFFSLLLLYYRKKFPPALLKTISFIINFEISRKVSFLILVIFLGIFIIYGIDKIENPEEPSWGDYSGAIQAIANPDFTSILGIFTNFRYILHFISLHAFGNMKIIAFGASISLFILTYLLILEITKKRFAGIISLAVLLQSELFLKYSTTITYDNLWTFFYVLSLYLVFKKWYLPVISQLLSIMSKQLSALFIPLSLFFIYRASTKENKKKLLISYLALFCILIIVETKFYSIPTNTLFLNEFLTGLSSLAIFLRFDWFVIIFILPIIVCLFICSRNGFQQADSFMILLSGILWSGPLLAGFTDYTNQPYRYVPLVVFFAISIGVLFSSKNIQQPLGKKNYVSNIVFLSTLVIIIPSLLFVVFPAIITGSYRLVL